MNRRDFYSIAAFYFGCTRQEAKERLFLLMYTPGSQDVIDELFNEFQKFYDEWIRFKPDDPYECVGGEA